LRRQISLVPITRSAPGCKSRVRKLAIRPTGLAGPCHGEIHSPPKSRYPAGAMFKEALQRVVDGTSGGLAGLLMDFEGIPLETYSHEDSPFDMEVVGAEVSVVVKAIQRASEMLEAGETQEVAFKSDKMVTLIRVINENYFLALTLTPEGNFGKGRYLLRVAAPRLREELG
jgi:predicted regulator of Ras-like GTPase activity (Roadblock/LC7/MglB family)